MRPLPFLAAGVAVLASACAALPPLSCAPGARSGEVAELLFGRSVAGRPAVGETEWRHFVAQEIAPRFPDGFTIVDASGQWRGGREASKILRIALPGSSADARARLDAVAAAYKQRFRQQSVGVILQPACISF